MREYTYDEVVWWSTTLADNSVFWQLGFFVALFALALIGYWFQNKR